MTGSVINALELTGDFLLEDYLIVRVILFHGEHNVQKPFL
jgi:hypothetical protein